MGRDTVPGFAAAIRAAREARQLSVEALAATAGVHADALYKLEREARAPSLKMAFTLADALGVSVDSLRAAKLGAPAKRRRGRPKKSA